MRYELSPDCTHRERGGERRLCEHCDGHADEVTPFEVPDLRKLLATGRYRAARVGRGRIELSPTDAGVEAAGGRATVYELTARTY